MPSQYSVSAANGVALASGTEANVASQLLQPGTYLVWGQINFDTVAATATKLKAGVSLVSASIAAQAGGNGLGPDPTVNMPLAFTLVTDTISLQCGPTLLTLTAPTTLYLVAKAAFSVGSITAYGTIGGLCLIGAGHNLVIS